MSVCDSVHGEVIEWLPLPPASKSPLVLNSRARSKCWGLKGSLFSKTSDTYLYSSTKNFGGASSFDGVEAWEVEIEVWKEDRQEGFVDDEASVLAINEADLLWLLVRRRLLNRSIVLGSIL